eukprot:g24512.t1
MRSSSLPPPGRRPHPAPMVRGVRPSSALSAQRSARLPPALGSRPTTPACSDGPPVLAIRGSGTVCKDLFSMPMNRSVSGPSFSTNSRSQLASWSQNASIDLSTVDRESLPIGVSKSFGSRMKLDARGSPALLELRMNYRNLLNEFKVHDGKLVSNQFALLRPRPKATLQKPKALEYPPGVDKAVFRKAALQRAKQLEGRTLASARIRAGEKVEDESSPRSKPDPTLQKEVREIARNAKDSLQTLLYRSSPDQPLALDEFAVVIHHFEVHRAQQIKAQFNQLDEDGSGAIDKGELRRLLWDTGYSVNRDTLDEIFDEVDKDKSGSVELKEFELVLKIVYDRFGFSRSEVKAFYTLFDRYDADLSGELSADELAGALGWCGHPTSIAEARDIIERYLEKSIQSISRPEFLRIMRCVAEEEIEEFRALFAAMDDDDSGYLDMHELAELFFKLGYTIHSSVIEEADCVHVLAYIRANEGFSKEEAQELKSVFRKFCSTGRDELREFELTRALSWLGYPLSSQRRRQLWCRVDLDKSGAIHEGEFLKLVRHLREEDVQRAALIGKAKSERAASDKELLALRERLPSLEDAPAPEAPASPPAAFEAAKPVVSEYSKWMDGAAEVLDEPAVSEPVVSEYSKWMEGGPAVEPTAAPEEVDDSDDADDDMDGGEGGSTGMRALWSKWWTKAPAFLRLFLDPPPSPGTRLRPPVGRVRPRRVRRASEERSLTVKFHCGAEELLDVTEPSRCAYEAQMKHPASCTPELLEALENSKRVRAMLNKIGYAPPPNILIQALAMSADTTGDAHTDIYGILSILRFIRVKKLRQSAGLSDQQVAKIRAKFSNKLEAGKRVEPQEFERFMSNDLFKSAKHSAPAQLKIQELIQELPATASSGLKFESLQIGRGSVKTTISEKKRPAADQENFVDGSLGLSEMFWVVRLYDDARAEATISMPRLWGGRCACPALQLFVLHVLQEAWALEEEIIQDAGFTTAQVAQFREFFVKAEVDGCGVLSDHQVTEILTELKATKAQKEGVNEALEAMEGAQETIDFPNFLRLMGIAAKKDSWKKLEDACGKLTHGNSC